MVTTMALKTKKTETTAKTQEHKNHMIVVTRAHELENCIMFDMRANDIDIYGCSYRTLQRKDGSGEFGKVSFPSRKGKDGKYYNEAYFYITEDDLDTIEKGIEEKLN